MAHVEIHHKRKSNTTWIWMIIILLTLMVILFALMRSTDKVAPSPIPPANTAAKA
ncbi:hypothetical protein HGH93_23675 [Chitinophaga polysaccharea]|uniref:hypothetical protein n=1 Tax=Chitinophaga TaxID=79328 RepID=UPI0014556385|nr:MULTISPECIES: hypothetical protein [Chitinophaga]NLR61121.1 hypothetical protein [Chitinophaga polysaccharea]NLU94959.1 hypothetical protein [Chitinophaga sp. Ak27]